MNIELKLSSQSRKDIAINNKRRKQMGQKNPALRPYPDDTRILVNEHINIINFPQ